MYNILICDDEQDIVNALKIYLSGGDYCLFEASNGREALEVVEKNDIHLILMDIMMPQLDGIAATAKLREKSNVPIILLTPIEFNILRLLMKNPGRIYSSAQIYELVWKEDSLGAETSVSVHIRHLRQKLEINPSEPRYLKVVWGLGYKMEDKK